MSASPEVMAANMPQQMPGQPPPQAPPADAPMMAPQKPSGAQEKAKVDVLMAVKMLEKALPPFGSTSKEGSAILKAITSLGKTFGKDEDSTEELGPAGLKTLVQGLAGPGAPPKPQGPPPGAPPGAGAPPPQPPPGA